MSYVKLKNCLTAEKLMKAFGHLNGKKMNLSKFELIKFLTNILEFEIAKGRGVDPRAEIKNRAHFILQDLLNENPRLVKEDLEMTKYLARYE